MGVFNENAIIGTSGAGASAYSIDNSCRFDDGDSAKLVLGSFQPSSAYTVNFWVKRGTLGTSQYVYRIGSADNLNFDTADKINIERRTGSLQTTSVYRDVSAWYNIHIKSTSSAYSLYVNGSLVQTTTSSSSPAAAGNFSIGTAGVSAWFDGYLAEFHWIDGSSLDPDSFGEVDETYGHWKPIEYTGSHGTNGFYLPFSDAGQRQIPQGDGTAIGTHTSGGNNASAFDGTTSQHSTSGAKAGVTATSWLGKDWGVGVTKTVSGFKCWSSNNDGLASSGGATSGCSITLFGNSVDNTGTAVNLGGLTSLNFRQNNHVADYTKLSGLTTSTAYRYHWVKFNTGAATPSDINCAELQFLEGTPNGLGVDAAGSNDFTSTNITASDQMVDSPTNNFATANSLNCLGSYTTSGGTGPAVTSMTNGNLQFVMNNSPHWYGWADSTMGMSSGKWYCEVRYDMTVSPSSLLGIVGKPFNIGEAYATNYIGADADEYAWYKAFGVRNSGANTGYGGVAPTDGNVLGIAVDLDNNKIYFHNGGTWLASGDPAGNSNGHPIAAVSTTRSGYYFFAFGSYGEGHTWTCNFGQDGTFAGLETAGGNADDNGYGNFKYDVPAGFLSLCSKNLPEPTVTPSEHFGTMLYDDGAGAKTFASHGIPTGARFQPDLVWLKPRGVSSHHMWTDAVRGVTKALIGNHYSVETTDSTGLTAFGADGFTVGSDGAYSDQTGDGMVAWNWKANGSGSSNTDGTINTTSTSANVAAGFSISTYTGNGSAGATVGHGLAVAPQLVMVKRRDNANNWAVGQAENSSYNWTGAMKLDAAEAWSADNRWNNTPPTSSVFSLSSDVSVNNNTSLFVAYCWHSVEGYSKIGVYTGNGNADGTFIYTGFAPAYVIRKRTNGANAWPINDTARNPYNLANYVVLANTSAAEGSTDNQIDFLSNGFKLRAIDAHGNASGGIYLYMAFAENPFKYANAR